MKSNKSTEARKLLDPPKYSLPTGTCLLTANYLPSPSFFEEVTALYNATTALAATPQRRPLEGSMWQLLEIGGPFLGVPTTRALPFWLHLEAPDFVNSIKLPGGLFFRTQACTSRGSQSTFRLVRFTGLSEGQHEIFRETTLTQEC